MGRPYYVVFQGTITNAGGDQDLIEITAADDKPVKLKGFTLAQTSEVGDSAEEGLRISVIRLPATVTSGSGGSTPTIQKVDSADVASGATIEVNNTTVATTSGTAEILTELAWNIRNSPFDFWYPPGFEPKIKGAEYLVVRMQTTPADDFSGAFTFFIEEE